MPKVCLGIESTAHTFGVGLVSSSGEILFNSSDTYRPKKGSGIIPNEAREHHQQVSPGLIGSALELCGKPDLISYSKGPGMGPMLHVGMNCAKALAKNLDIPLVGVNHCIAHVEIGALSTGAKNPITLYVSGGNTQVLALTEGRYRVFGETLDIAIGNAMDVLARNLGMNGAPDIEGAALKGAKLLELPYTVKGMDLSFSGIVTHCSRLANKENVEDICYSFQEYCFAMLTEVTERAVAHVGRDEVLLTGGVARNKRLSEMLRIMCEERGAKFFAVPKELAGDNGAMIAWLGLLMQDQALKNPEDATVGQRFRTDEVDVTWKK